MKAKTAGRPRTDSSVTVLPSWSVSRNGGSPEPGGRTAPAQPLAGTLAAAPSLEREASSTPASAPATQNAAVISAMWIRACTARQDRPARLEEPLEEVAAAVGGHGRIAGHHPIP